MGDIVARGMRIVPRDGQTGGKLSTSTIVTIAVVCGCVVILVLALFLWRLLARLCKRKESAPLPPRQDLAHHREQQLAAFSASRPTTTWLGDTFSLGGRGNSLGPASSNTSLLPERKASYYLDDVGTAESTSELPSPLSNEDLMLTVPGPTFTLSDSAHTSMTSMASSTGSIPPVVDPSSFTNPTDTMSSTSHNPPPSSSQILTDRGLGSPSARRSRSNPRSLSHPRSRPVSMSSFSGTTHSVFTQRSGSVIRGAPHAPYSGVQIVLPAPLAPQVYPYMQPLAEGSTTSLRLDGLPDTGRSSTFVDQWINIGSLQSNDQSLQEAGNSRRRRDSAGRLRKHTATSSESYQSAQPTAQDRHRRSTSQPRLSSERKPSSLSISSVPDSPSATPYQPPPVPRIPSVYGAAPLTQSAQLPTSTPPSDERGRPRTSRSDSKPS